MKTPQRASAVYSIDFFLNPKVFSNPNRKQQISEHLAGGGLVVIRNAMQRQFAASMSECLEQMSEWQLFEGEGEHFHYHHHNVFEEKLFPPALSQCHEVFRAEATRRFMADLSQRDCSGEMLFAPSLYLPGDHSLPHNDVMPHNDGWRQVAFVWHLTKHWQPNWGGDFYWCSKTRPISPSFNTLILFNVGYNSVHFVTHVSAYASSKRLAISGWWTGKGSEQNQATASATNQTMKRKLVELV